MLQSASRAWNVVDYLFVRDSASHPDVKDGIESVRQIVSSVYDFEYRTKRELYGEVRDEDFFGPEEDQVDSPFQQFNPKRNARPNSLSPLTPHDESGYTGLDAPLG